MEAPCASCEGAPDDAGLPGGPPFREGRSFVPLPLPAVAGITFPLLLNPKGMGGPSEGPPRETSPSGGPPQLLEGDAHLNAFAQKRGPPGEGPYKGNFLEDVRVLNGEVCFFGRGIRFRVLECIRSFVRLVSGREGYMCLVQAVTTGEVPIHLKAVCLPGLLGAAVKIRRKRDRFLTQLCSIIMNKTLPVRTPQHATEGLARLLPARAREVLGIPRKQKQRQQQQQQEQQQLICGSFPVIAVGSELSLPLRLCLLAHSTRGLALGLNPDTAQPTEVQQQSAAEPQQRQAESQQQQVEPQQQRQAATDQRMETPTETETTTVNSKQQLHEPLVALQALQSVLFKALELSVPLLADPFMAPSAFYGAEEPRQQQQQQQQPQKVRLVEQQRWCVCCKDLNFRAVSSRAGLSAAVSRVIEAPVGGPSRPLALGHSVRPLQQPQQQLLLQQMASGATSAARGLLLLSQRGLSLTAGEEHFLSSLGISDSYRAYEGPNGGLPGGPQEAFVLKGGDLTALYRCVAVMTGLFEWKAQIFLYQNLLNPKEKQLADSACAALLVLIKDRWCQQVLQQQQQQEQQQLQQQLAASSHKTPQLPALTTTAAEEEAAEAAASGQEEPTLRDLNLRLLTFVVQTQLLQRHEPVAEGAERLSCVLNWLKLLLLPGKPCSSRGSTSSSSSDGCSRTSSNPFHSMGLLLVQSQKQVLVGALSRLASQVDAEELLTRPQGQGNEAQGPQCLLPCAAPSTADKIELLRPCGGGIVSNAAQEQRARLHLVCLVLEEVRDLVQQAVADMQEERQQKK